MPVFNNILAGAAGQNSAYTLEKSVRFNDDDTAYLSKTFSSAGNRRTWTWAAWVKLSGTTVQWLPLFEAFDGTDLSTYNYLQIAFYYNQLGIANDTTWLKRTTATFRDYSGWMHVVCSFDTTQTTADDRVKIYVNGSQVTDFSVTTDPSINNEFGINRAITHQIGQKYTSSNFGNSFFDGYLADIYFIDGQSLEPTSFGKFDVNNVWQAKKFTGTYGNNGFHLFDFANESVVGADSSGNNNDWTATNISTTAGADNDVLFDVPTNGTQSDTGAGGEVSANYCCLNPIDKVGTVTLSNGNLKAYITGTTSVVRGSFAVSSGKWYWEFVSDTPGMHGIGDVAYTDNNWYNGEGGYFYYGGGGATYQSPNTSAFYGNGYTNSDVIGVALDADNGNLYFYKNGTIQNSGTAAFTGLTGTYAPAFGDGGGNGLSVTVNFGARPFAYSAPSGYKALCSTNASDTTITTSGSYTGNSNADGPFVYLNGVPTAMSIGGTAVTFGTGIDKLSNGFKIRSATTNNTSGTSYNYSVTTTGDPFKTSRAQTN